MARVDLQVPYFQKDEAKALGARWDPKKKVWYAPEGVDVGPMACWLPACEDPGPKFSVRSPDYHILESTTGCYRCNAVTEVFAFMLPEGHEEFEYIDDLEDDLSSSPISGEWHGRHSRARASSITSLSPGAVNQMQRFTTNFKVAYSKMANARYWMNHCQHCGAKLGDFFMHSEPEGAFLPISEAQASEMILYKVDEPFEADCSLGYSFPDFVEYMQVSNAKQG